jgi:septal ring factor EnvC (AmiA/AmiB activator)
MASRSSRGLGAAGAVLGAWCWVLGAGAQVPSVPAPSGQLPGPQDATAQTQALTRRAAERLQALQKEAESLAKQERTLLVELRSLEVQREIKVEELTTVERQSTDVARQLADATTRARALENAAEQQRPEVEARMVRLYKMGRAGYWRLLLDVNSLREVGRAYRTAAALARIDRDRIEEHRRTLTELNTERATLEARAKQLAVLKRKARDAQAAVDAAVNARTDLVKQIDHRRDLNVQLTGELQEAQQKLQGTLVELAAGHDVAAGTLPLRPFQGALAWPAEGIVTARFGRSRSGAAAPSTGIELSLAEGAPVHAVYEGTVAYADPFSGFGNLVIVDHGDKSYSLYGHLESVSVKKGDRIEGGGTVGLAGRNPSGNPSLYFELRIDGKAVDPLQWLKRP